ncbi:MAG: hypothetical protein IPN20_17405 [Haliscomenobacter sp.]|nr:hypothetical protein [Haliscomenobacter sp.]
MDQGDTAAFAFDMDTRWKNVNYKLDITWLKDDSLEDADSLPELQELATEAVTNRKP